MESKPRFELILRRFGAKLVQTPVKKTATQAALLAKASLFIQSLQFYYFV